MKKFFIYITVLFCLIVIGICVLVNNPTPDEKISRIGIGGGGAFFNPMVDTIDENCFYVTSDMGAFYYSYNKGQTWNRSEARAVFAQTHISSSGVIFAGGNGVYHSLNKGKTLELIYPKNVIYNISRCGWNENLMFAKDYDNGYVKCITSNTENVFFITIDWEGKLKLIQCDYNGDNLEILHTEQTTYYNPMSDIDVYISIVDAGLYIGFGSKIKFFNFENKTIIDVYTTLGCIKDICLIENNIFFIDDLENESRILYTSDFINFNNLLDYNTLENKFTKYGREGTFNWHFKEIVGNNFNNIYLSFSSSVNEFEATVDGIMKFNGSEFEWIFDSMYKTRFRTELNGWSYGCHGPFYGIYASSHNDNVCLVANIETVYLMEYEKEETKKIKTLHCNDYGDGIYSTNGLDVQTTYFVKEDPFDKNHIIICTTDLGLQNSYDNGKTWQRMEITGEDYDIYNTCYDLYFDKYKKNVVYGIWSSKHDAPYNPTIENKVTTKGAFAISNNGGKTWNFCYNNGIPTDAIPVKMSIKQNQNEFVIAIATFNRGFYLSDDGGENFISINKEMEKVEGLIYGEDIILTDEYIYCLTAPYLENGSWKASKLYEYNLTNKKLNNINLGNLILVRSLTYSKEKGLFLNVIPTYSYKWYEEYDNGFWVNENGGIYLYAEGKFHKFFENNDGIFYSTFSKNGKLYATDTYGKVFVINDDGGKILHEGLFNMLKNISFSLDEKTMYITTFGGGVYRVKV